MQGYIEKENRLLRVGGGSKGTLKFFKASKRCLTMGWNALELAVAEENPDTCRCRRRCRRGDQTASGGCGKAAGKAAEQVPDAPDNPSDKRGPPDEVSP